MKKLIKYTILPQDLYVDREADRQLKRIVNEMQRPGYVLVARQMGKTNLLFNAKRNLETTDVRFVYIDMSNMFNSQLDCYRNIIDLIVESQFEGSITVDTQIIKIRKLSSPPHIEYTKCLRFLLKEFSGKLVLVLDEIDALKSVSYSDHVFAQIRSNYFARVNYPEFERLTYLLSGVIEPIDLIKDKNKSPFNIGEKIYLDDFTLSEHEEFVRKSMLDINHEISLFIFEQTGGNPRLTFDILSELEDKIIEGQNIFIEDVEKVIKKKYLTNFDVAPVDHIRELVQDNKMARKAVRKLQSGINNISDEEWKKLYLFGIVGAKKTSKVIIKNRIISDSLTLEWINSVDNLIGDLFAEGYGSFSNKRFEDAIEIFTRYLSETDIISNSNKDIANFTIGRSYYNLGKFELASEKFKEPFSTKPLDKEARMFQGLAMMASGQSSIGAEIIETELKTAHPGYTHNLAKINLAYFYSDVDSIKTERIVDSLLKDLSSEIDDGENGIDYFLTASRYLKAATLVEKDEINGALELILLAMNSSAVEYMPEILRYKTELDGDSSGDDILRAKNLIIDNSLNFESSGQKYLGFNEFILLNILYTLHKLRLYDDRDELVSYAVEKLYTGRSEWEILAIVGKVVKKKHDLALYTKYVIDKKIITVNSEHIGIIRVLLMNSDDKVFNYLDYFNTFVSLISSDVSIFVASDIKIMGIGNGYEYQESNFLRLISNVEIFEKCIGYVPLDKIHETFLVYYWKAYGLYAINLEKEAKLAANRCISIIEEYRDLAISLITKEGLESVRRQMYQIIGKTINSKPVLQGKKIQRNTVVKVEYINGDIKLVKFKKIEKDYRNGQCKILEINK
ncbi:AAA-like domain-containing protein [Neolewinella antarctica]|uniref:Tetratricopeptide (TPR) repeat protein n=1 Tax=Neolewinella antarctica TaxID=442734 RepID=A0ABX0XE99_9BACT|nr:AAA-like domain-containing protein [Neolewinella antarctica]NJC27639.1 tetratricopeptide (TPR) repeat protein [Neolewinella antarctica]